jgi:hypothetical protein
MVGTLAQDSRDGDTLFQDVSAGCLTLRHILPIKMENKGEWGPKSFVCGGIDDEAEQQ